MKLLIKSLLSFFSGSPSVLSQSPTQSLAATNLTQGSLPRTLVTIHEKAWSSNKKVKLTADVVINIGTHMIADVKNIKFDACDSAVTADSIVIGQPIYWYGGRSATVTVTYIEKKKVTCDIVTFYPNSARIHTGTATDNCSDNCG